MPAQARSWSGTGHASTLTASIEHASATFVTPIIQIVVSESLRLTDYHLRRISVTVAERLESRCVHVDSLEVISRPVDTLPLYLRGLLPSNGGIMFWCGLAQLLEEDCMSFEQVLVIKSFFEATFQSELPFLLVFLDVSQFDIQSLLTSTWPVHSGELYSISKVMILEVHPAQSVG